MHAQEEACALPGRPRLAPRGTPEWASEWQSSGAGFVCSPSSSPGRRTRHLWAQRRWPQGQCCLACLHTQQVVILIHGCSGESCSLTESAFCLECDQDDPRDSPHLCLKTRQGLSTPARPALTSAATRVERSGTPWAVSVTVLVLGAAMGAIIGAIMGPIMGAWSRSRASPVTKDIKEHFSHRQTCVTGQIQAWQVGGRSDFRHAFCTACAPSIDTLRQQKKLYNLHIFHAPSGVCGR